MRRRRSQHPRGAALAIAAAGAAWLLLCAPVLVHAEPRVLVFSKTAGFRHDSIADGVALVAELAGAYGFAVEATEDGGAFSDAGLAPYRGVVFLNTTGDVLDPAQEEALERWVTSGGGWVGVHAAADTEYDWPFYGALLGGAWFLSHPQIQSAVLDVSVAGSFSRCCDHWGPAPSFTDEWYNFRSAPADATVLAYLDESSYDPGAGAMGEQHPIVWQRFVGAGRAFYTGLGHRREMYADERFRRHLAAGVRWAARIPPGDCDDDHGVDVYEVLLGVEIALDRLPLEACAAFDVGRDAAVSVEELVEGIASGL